MSIQSLGNQQRLPKPRQTGLTMINDQGMPLHAFEDLIYSYKDHIDCVCFGSGMALVSQCLTPKIQMLRTYCIPFFFDGTLFELAYSQRRLSAFHDFLSECRAGFIMISDGTIDMPHADKQDWIRELSCQFSVISKIGKKASEIRPDTENLCEAIHAELEAGAYWVALEGGNGTSGLYHSTGDPRASLIARILNSGLPRDRLFFEAPRKEQQAFLIGQAGPDINLANIVPGDVVSLETLRLGLGSETFWAPYSESSHSQNAWP